MYSHVFKPIYLLLSEEQSSNKLLPLYYLHSMQKFSPIFLIMDKFRNDVTITNGAFCLGDSNVFDNMIRLG